MVSAGGFPLGADGAAAEACPTGERLAAVRRAYDLRGSRGAVIVERRPGGRLHPGELTRERGTVRNSAPPVALAGSYLRDTRHVCAFFRSDDEEYEVLLPFIRDGFDCGDKALHVLNPHQRHGHLRRLATAGIDTAAAEARGQLEVRSNTDTYLPDGRFDQQRMLETFERLAGGDAARGFARSRIVCHMDWASETRMLVDDVIEFESRVNDVWSRHEDMVICTYQLRHLSGDAVIDVVRTHPMVIIGGLLQRNPFFVPPEHFLPEMRERRASRTTQGAAAD